jgi:predicted TIM-barrel fold metal-dependent hydrolase
MFIDADSHLTLKNLFDGFSYDKEFADNYRRNGDDTTLATHQKFLEEQHIHRQLINWGGISTGMKYRLPKDLGVQVMRHYNDGVMKVCEQDSRFDATLWLALQSVDHSLKEIERTKDCKFFGYHFSDCVAWALLPEYDEIFSRLAKLKIPVYLHIGGFFDQPYEYDRSDPVYCKVLSEYPDPHDARDRWLPALVTFITSGLLDRIPDLRIVIAERDIHWIRPLQTYMLQNGWSDPLPYFKKNFWFTTEPESTTFLQDAEFVGWDRLLFSTDFPHSTTDRGGSNQYNDVATVQALDLPAEKLAAFTWQNYIKLFNRI